jgi:hypothetical protein
MVSGAGGGRSPRGDHSHTGGGRLGVAISRLHEPRFRRFRSDLSNRSRLVLAKLRPVLLVILSMRVTGGHRSAWAPVPPFGHLLWVLGHGHAATLWNPRSKGPLLITPAFPGETRGGPNSLPI